MLVYPEISDNEELEELTQMFEQVEKFFLEQGERKKIFFSFYGTR